MPGSVRRAIERALAKTPADRFGSLLEFLAAVEAVHDLLADGRFIGYVVRQRQQALLGVASELLGDLTGRRYGFAADFQVVDRLTGQPHCPVLGQGEA